MKKILIIAIALYSCSSDKGTIKNTDNGNSIPNPPSDTQYQETSYVSKLMTQHRENWPEIFFALKNEGVDKLSVQDIEILRAKQEYIEQDLQTKDPQLLQYFYQTSGLTVKEKPEPPADNSNTQKAAIKQKIQDDITTIVVSSQEYSKTISDLWLSWYSIFKPDELGKVLENKDNEIIRQLFTKITKRANGSKEEEPVRYKEFPKILSNQEYKDALGEKELRREVYRSLINAFTCLEPVGNDVEKEKVMFKKSLYSLSGNTIPFPLTNTTELLIAYLFIEFGIKYNDDFTAVVYNGEAGEKYEEFQLFCLVFTQYILKKFGVEIVNESGKPKLRLKDGYKLLANDDPFHFCSHQMIGLVWAVMNTAFTKFPIKHTLSRDQITSNDDFVINMEGMVKTSISNEEIVKLIRNSLFEGVGFISKRDGMDFWTQHRETDWVEQHNGYACLDYRYILSLVCNSDKYFKAQGPFNKIKGDGYQLKDPSSTSQGTKLFGQDGVAGTTKVNDCSNPIFGSLAAMYGLTDVHSTKLHHEGHNFYGGIDFNRVEDAIKALKDEDDVLAKFVGLLSQCAAEKGIEKEPYIEIMLRESSAGDKTLYKKFYDGILKDLYQFYKTRHENSQEVIRGVEGQDKVDLRYELGVCKGLCFKSNDEYEKTEAHRNMAAQNYFLSIFYRTYECIGTFALLDSIMNNNNWIVRAKS